LASDEVCRNEDSNNEVIVGDDSEWQAYWADRVGELLRQDNRGSRSRQAPKNEQSGSFANSSMPEDLTLIVSQQQEKIAAEQSRRKEAKAQAAGVFYNVLLPPDQEDFDVKN
jgi:hypothetical protein